MPANPGHCCIHTLIPAALCCPCVLVLRLLVARYSNILIFFFLKKKKKLVFWKTDNDYTPSRFADTSGNWPHWQLFSKVCWSSLNPGYQEGIQRVSEWISLYDKVWSVCNLWVKVVKRSDSLDRGARILSLHYHKELDLGIHVAQNLIFSLPKLMTIVWPDSWTVLIFVVLIVDTKSNTTAQTCANMSVVYNSQPMPALPGNQ